MWINLREGKRRKLKVFSACLWVTLCVNMEEIFTIETVKKQKREGIIRLSLSRPIETK